MKKSLNAVYKLVWDASKKALIPVSEHSKSNGKKSSLSKAVVAASVSVLIGALSVSANVSAQQVTQTDDTVVVDGEGSGGYIILDGVTTVDNANKQTIYTNFFTQGGDGSGGGAGLGGVFFVNDGASLLLNNVNFSSNAIKGGQGGDARSAEISDITIAILEKSSAVGSIPGQQFSADISSVGGNYFINSVTYDDIVPSIESGQFVSVVGSDELTSIDSISGNQLVFADAIQVSSDAINAFDAMTVSGSSTLDVSGVTAGLRDAFVVGMIITGTGIPDGTTIVSVTRDLSSGDVESIVLSNAMTVSSGMMVPDTSIGASPGDMVFQGANVSLDSIYLPATEVSRFSAVAGQANQISMNASGLGLVEGMELITEDSNGNKVSTGIIITDITDNIVTLSNPVTDLNGELSFDATLPVIQDNGTSIFLSVPDRRLQIGMNVSYADGQSAVITNITEEGKITLDVPNGTLTSTPEQLTITNTLSTSSNSVTLANVNGLSVGTFLSGDGVTGNREITNITQESNGTYTVELGAASTVFGLGGVMNANASSGLPSASDSGSDGSDGVNGRVGYAFLNEGEGQDALNGYGADSAEDGYGYGGNGGDGGDGSGGMGFNYQLTKEIIDTTTAMLFEYAEATSNFGNLPFPDGAEAGFHFAAAISEAINLGEAIANFVIWNEDLANGLVGRGGEGGEGGEAGAGSDFFGGGRGGDGGNGGEGALANTDGGDGGSGGRGGNGGFGAGGGLGGAGGDAGTTGSGAGGDPGDGGDAGFGAGEGSRGDGQYGGGGSGFGGAIFIRDGGTFVLSGNSIFENNYAFSGSSNNRGEAGEAAGTDIFMMTGSDVLLSPGSGNVIRIEGTISDDSQGTYDSASFAAGDGADLRIGGGGLVQLVNENTYTGATIIEGATLEANLGEGINDDSRLLFAGQGRLTNDNSDNSVSAHANAGVLLTSGEINRRVDIWPNAIRWSGAGGFAAATEETLVLNFGAITSDQGQQLVWNSSSISNDSVFVFGSEFGVGTVELKNDININGSQANVLVFDNDLSDLDYALFSGNLTNGGLNVGDAGYTGALILSGNNELNSLDVNNGLVATFGEGTISSPGQATQVDVNGGSLVLSNDENLDNVTVAQGAMATFMGFVETQDIDNSGTMLVMGGMNANSIINRSGNTMMQESDISAVTFIENTATGMWLQNANTSAADVINDGVWQLFGDSTNGTDANRVISAQTLTGAGEFVLASTSVTLDGETEPTDIQGHLELELSDTSLFDGVISGAGDVTKTAAGNLQITNAQTFTGDLTVSAGTFTTLAASGSQPGGTLADVTDVIIQDTGTFVANNQDVVNSITLDLGAVLNMNTSLTTQLGTENNGLINVSDSQTLAMGTGLSGNGDIVITGEVVAGNVDTTTGLSLSQAGNTAYSGTISGDASFTKLGEGILSLDGQADSVALDGLFIVDEGAIVTNSENVFDSALMVDVNENGALGFVTGNQRFANITNSGLVEQGDVEITISGTIENEADGLWAQNGQVNTDQLINEGLWNQLADVSATDIVINGDTFVYGDISNGADATRVMMAETLTGSGNIILSTVLTTIAPQTTPVSVTGNVELELSETSLFDGVISGAGDVTKTDDGDLQISNAQTFTGDLTVAAGTFTTMAPSAGQPGGTLSDLTDVIVNSQATFVANNADTVQSFTLDSGAVLNMNVDLTATQGTQNNGLINVDGSQELTTNLSGSGDIVIAGEPMGAEVDTTSGLTLTQNGNSIYSGTITSNASFTKEGSGNLSLDGAADSIALDGMMVINSGGIITQSENVLDSALVIDVNDNGNLAFMTGDQRFTAITNSGNVEQGDVEVTLSDTVDNESDGMWIQNGQLNTDQLNNQGTWWQAANVNATDIVIDGVTNIMGNTADAVDATRVMIAETLTGSGNIVLATSSVDVDGQDTPVEVQGNVELQLSDLSVFDGVISGAGNVTKTDTGELQITNAQTFTGDLIVAAGTFTTNAASGSQPGGTLSDLADVVINDGAIFMANNTDTVASFTLDTGATLEMNVDLTTRVGNNNNGLINVNGSQQFTMLTGLGGSGDIVINGDINAGEVDLSSGLTLVQSGNTVYSGTISSDASFIKQGDGTLAFDGLSDSVSLDGTLVVDEGAIVTQSENVLASDLSVDVNDAGTLGFAAGAQRFASITNSGMVNQANVEVSITETINNESDGTWVQNGQVNAEQIINEGLWMQGANIDVSDLSMNGTLQVFADLGGATDATRVIVADTLSGNGDIVLGTSTVGDQATPVQGSLALTLADDSSFDGVVSGAGMLIKNGLGNLTLSNSQDFTGGLTVEAGTLTTAPASDTQTGGLFADNLAIQVKDTAVLTLNNADTIGSLLLDSGASFNMNADLSTQAGLENNGLININNERTLTMGTGLTGTGNIALNTDAAPEPATLTLNQTGDTIYAGSISGNGNLVKSGLGDLGFGGAPGSIDIDGLISVNSGTLSLHSVNVLAATSDVHVAANASLMLVSGNQAIDELSGFGMIDLGDNSLQVNDGGEFEGLVEGAGRLSILGGEFNVVNSIVSTEGTFEVDNSASTDVQDGAMLAFKEVVVQTGGTLDVGGRIEASNNVVVEADSAMHGNGGFIVTNEVSVYGDLSGELTVEGDVTIQAGGDLSPGNSPGQMTFTNLNLMDESTVTMEIRTNQEAGLDFDQIVITDSFVIGADTSFSLIKLENELAQNEQVKLFDFAPGKVSGFFGSANSDYQNEMLLNVATGTAISLGNLNEADFVDAVVTNNDQRGMLSSLNMVSQGNLSQYYGGNLLPSLSNALANNQSTDAVFNAFSPKHFVALYEQSKVLAVNALPVISTNARADSRYFDVAFEDQSVNSVSINDLDQFKLNNQSLALTLVENKDNNQLKVVMQVDDVQTKSANLTSNGKGASASVGYTHNLFDSAVSARYMASFADHNYDTNRSTLNGFANAGDIGATTTIAGLGLGYANNINGYAFSASIDALYFDAKVDAFTEVNNTNVLDALNVEQQHNNGSLTMAKIGFSKDINNVLAFKMNAGYMKFDDAAAPIIANVAPEVVSFADSHTGLGDSLYSLDMSLRYQLKEQLYLGLSLSSLDEKFAGSLSNYQVEVRYFFD